LPGKNQYKGIFAETAGTKALNEVLGNFDVSAVNGIYVAEVNMAASGKNAEKPGNSSSSINRDRGVWSIFNKGKYNF